MCTEESLTVTGMNTECVQPSIHGFRRNWCTFIRHKQSIRTWEYFHASMQPFPYIFCGLAFNNSYGDMLLGLFFIRENDPNTISPIMLYVFANIDAQPQLTNITNATT
jgi:hypothetical protein